MAKNKQNAESVEKNEIVKYIVIEKFKDLQDHQYIYEIGEEFPRVGLTVTQERIEELASANNLTKKVLIKKQIIETVEEKNEEQDEASEENNEEDNEEQDETSVKRSDKENTKIDEEKSE